LLSDLDYLYICNLCKKITGISIDLSKKYLIDSRLSKFIKTNNIPSIGTLVKQLNEKQTSTLHEKVAYSLLTHETLFFRDKHHFDKLASHILENFTAHKSINIWSAACSTGQEPYSIAMSINELLSIEQSKKIHITASDISEDVIDFAKKGIYTKFLLSRGIEPHILKKYFYQVNEDEWEICQRVKDLVTFKKINLMAPFWTLPPLNVVFIRNVLIYFKSEERKKVLHTLKKYLNNGGIVVTGTGEDIANIDNSFVKKNIDWIIFYELNK